MTPPSRRHLAGSASKLQRRYWPDGTGIMVNARPVSVPRWKKAGVDAISVGVPDCGSAAAGTSAALGSKELGRIRNAV
jgi:hypothetical protein